MNRSQSYVVYLLLFVAIIALFVYNFRQQNNSSTEIPINQVANDLQNGLIGKITVNGNNIQLVYKDGTNKVSTKDTGSTLLQQLTDFGVTPAGTGF